MAGEGDKLKGKIKEVAGAATGNEKTEGEGARLVNAEVEGQKPAEQGTTSQAKPGPKR